MKAFVLAAGASTRLRPLTMDIPKPMIPILGKPALYYTFLNLWKNGFTVACVNTYYRPDIITNFFQNNDINIKLEFLHEKKILGTAGAIKNKEEFFEDTFVVMSGDGLTDINLKKAVEFHKKKKSLATIVLKKINLRFEYGIAITNKDGEIKSFVEKPLLGDVFNDEVNTGIYVFEPEIFKFIPKNKFFDFSMDLFPFLMKKKIKIYGYVMDEYWTDIGNIVEYKKGVFDALDGKLKIIPIIKNRENKYISSNAKIDKSVKICGPCFVGNNVVIGKNAVIEPYSVISDNVTMGNNVSVEKSIIWENSEFGDNVKITNTVVGSDTLISSNVTLFDSIVMEYSNK
ncbi:MAG: NDP-sugar synthase [Endomicrobium sp.]|uniref:sugar phosphate nucleotidyltransferase n=1 Tax=Candidatus Endomicrobiellum pyrsonymphae TaxID=1408203 RepID=UPI00357C1179|nr:NDP-sugar synthase [Endomicrobium sp.]